MRAGEWALVVPLVIAGLYFVLFHQDPMPFNHVAVGLGDMHSVHDMIGVVLIGVGGLVWWRSRRMTRAKAPM